MRLFLAAILSCAALFVGVLAQADWKAYYPGDATAVAMPDDSRSDTLLADMGPGREFIDLASERNGYPAELTTSSRDGQSRATRTLERPSEVGVHRKAPTALTESAGLLARHESQAFSFKDSSGRTVKMEIDFDEHSFEMLAEGIGKEKLAKVKKLLSSLNLPELAERELRKQLARGQGWERKERRQAQREAQDEVIRVERAEPAESRREQTDYLRSECPDKIDRTTP